MVRFEGSAMTQSQILERLAGKRVSRVDFKEGQPLVCPRPALVEYADNSEGEHPDAWIGVSEDGLTLHFNAKDQYGEMRGQEEPFSNIENVR